MKEQDKKLIWKLLDGEYTPKEHEQAQQCRSEEDAFNQAFLEREHLHQSLQKVEAEQPPMRFALNVMERLPQFYQRTIKPLISPIWVKGFLYTMSALIVAYLGSATYYVVTNDRISPDVVPGAQPLNDFFGSLNNQTWLMVGMLGFSYLFFVWLDKTLKKRFADKKSSGSEFTES